MERDFCRGWKFHKHGEPSTIVDIPHDTMLVEPRTEHCHNGDKTGYFPGGKYLRKVPCFDRAGGGRIRCSAFWRRIPSRGGAAERGRTGASSVWIHRVYRETVTPSNAGEKSDHSDRGQQPVPLGEDQIAKLPDRGSAKFNALSMRLGKIMSFQTKGKQADRALEGISRELDVLGQNYGHCRNDKELTLHGNH